MGAKKNRTEIVDSWGIRTAIAQAIARLLLAARAVSVILSSHLCTEAARAPYDFRPEAAETARLLHSNCMISVQSPSSLCTDLPWPAPEGQHNIWHDARR